MQFIVLALMVLMISNVAKADSLPRIGETFRDCDTCPEMVVIEAGTYVMGSPDEEKWRNRYQETPRRSVQVPRFAIAAKELTFAEWEACVGDGGCNGYWPDDNGWGRGDRPVINVSADDARAYIKWINGKIPGAPYRLPSEAE